MKRLFALLGVALVLGACQPSIAPPVGPYEPNVASLEGHNPVPDWMRDAKFGIYVHWGVYSVPAYGNEQYYYYMHRDSLSENFLMGGHRRHEALWGSLEEFGYHDFIPMFKAERFDPDEWATLFRESGAQFAGMVAEHHDGFSMWDSEHTPFSAAKMGPKRDVVGELGRAIKQRGMKFFLSLHHENNYTYVQVKPNWAANNRKYERLYGCLMEHGEWLQMWHDKACEVVDKYSPDIIYFDAWMDQIPDSLKYDFLAHYFNRAHEQGKEVVVTYKYEELPRTICMLDHEMHAPTQIDPEPWLTDLTISDGYHRSWGYVKGMQLLSHQEIIRHLVRVVSNNGRLLLNLSPMADGTIPRDQQDVVQNVGVWLWSYGEAIYGTRPYAVSGEVADGCQVHYTRKEDALYAIFLDWPGQGRRLCLRSVCDELLGGRRVKSATLLSVKRNYNCAIEQQSDGLWLTIPENGRYPSDAAQVVRLDLE